LKDKKPILLCLFALFAVLFTVFFMVYVASYEEENEFTQIGSSEFYATPQGKIYALIPSGGLHHSLLGDDVVLQAAGCQVHATGGVGGDERAVYCGNLAMSGINPARA